MTRKPTPIYQIKVTLNGTRPPIWRRILVPGSTSLLKLHDILQTVMGWEDYHLHLYDMDGIIYGNPEDDEYGDLGTLNEANYKLSEVIYGEGQRFTYEYDFGDGWEHTLLVEKILPREKGVRYPVCLKGRRACPPEDVGGVWGYEEFLEAIRDPNHPEHEENLEWVGEDFDPEAFDLEDVNFRLSIMGRGRSTEALDAWSREEDEASPNWAAATSWMQKLPGDQLDVAENLPLRRDVIALLRYLRDNKVLGTKSTGNLPLKAVHEICAQFVNPPLLEGSIGERVYRVRSETDVWSLYFRHVLASVGGLATGGMGRRWMLTPLGEHFLVAPAPLQVWLLFSTWWNKVNWVIASPFGYGDGYLPDGFTRLTLTHLLASPKDASVQFESFADRLIKATRLVWPIENQEMARIILKGLVGIIVIHPLVDFGILETTYAPHKTLGEDFRELSTFQITSFGRGLLEEVRRV